MQGNAHGAGVVGTSNHSASEIARAEAEVIVVFELFEVFEAFEVFKVHLDPANAVSSKLHGPAVVVTSVVVSMGHRVAFERFEVFQVFEVFEGVVGTSRRSGFGTVRAEFFEVFEVSEAFEVFDVL